MERHSAVVQSGLKEEKKRKEETSQWPLKKDWMTLIRRVAIWKPDRKGKSEPADVMSDDVVQRLRLAFMVIQYGV
jgi:hypothetical protein